MSAAPGTGPAPSWEQKGTPAGRVVFRREKRFTSGRPGSPRGAIRRRSAATAICRPGPARRIWMRSAFHGPDRGPANGAGRLRFRSRCGTRWRRRATAAQSPSRGSAHHSGVHVRLTARAPDRPRFSQTTSCGARPVPLYWPWPLAAPLPRRASRWGRQDNGADSSLYGRGHARRTGHRHHVGIPVGQRQVW